MTVQPAKKCGIKRISIACLPGRGHLYPATALGRKLVKHGYEVTILSRPITRGVVKAANLNFHGLGDPPSERPTEVGELNLRHNGPNTLTVIYAHADSVLRQARDILASLACDCLIVDQADLASGSVADSLGIPFVNVSFALPLYLDDEVPPFIYAWPPKGGESGRIRNKRANTLLERLISPTMNLVNEQRKLWNLPLHAHLNDFFSTKAIITQLPISLDFPWNVPAHFYHTGLFRDETTRPPVPFPWQRLGPKPLIYACMGTVRNNLRRTFEVIAEACEFCNAQLVISLGGTGLLPEDLGSLPGDPIVVHYAPQYELLKRATLSITHAGLNSTLESLENGVPVIAMPVSDDQPGVAARVKWHGAGIALPSPPRSRSDLALYVTEALENAQYRRRALSLREEFIKLNPLQMAIEIIQRTVA